jgi:uncharacterized C2H2 Zn-finger protein
MENGNNGNNGHSAAQAAVSSNRPTTFPCPSEGCGAVFARRFNRDRHLARNHAGLGRVYDCVVCGLIFHSAGELRRHVETAHRAGDGGDGRGTEFAVRQVNFRGACRTYRKRYDQHVRAAVNSLEGTVLQDAEHVETLMARAVAEHPSCKFAMIAVVAYVKHVGGGGGGGEDDDKGEDGYDGRQQEEEELTDSITHYHRSPSYPLTRYQNYGVIFHAAYAAIKKWSEDFVERGSGWILDRVLLLDVELAQTRALNGACGWDGPLSVSSLSEAQKLQVEAPRPGQQQDCFFLAVASFLTGSRDGETCRRYYRAHLDTAGFRLPVSLSQVPRFERLHAGRLDLQVNVLYEEGGEVFPVYASPRRQSRVCNLLLAADEGRRMHFALVSDLERLLSRRGRDGQTGRVRSYNRGLRCANCLQPFSVPSALQSHRQLCLLNQTQRVDLPGAGETVKFAHFWKRFRKPLVGFFDFETVMARPASACLTCHPMAAARGCRHRSTVEAEQVPVTFALVVLDLDGNIVHQHCDSRETDAAEAFLDHLLDIEPALRRHLEEKKPLQLTGAEEAAFRAADSCHICGGPFLPGGRRGEGNDLDDLDDQLAGERSIKCRDHCHLTGR